MTRCKTEKAVVKPFILKPLQITQQSSEYKRAAVSLPGEVSECVVGAVRSQVERVYEPTQFRPVACIHVVRYQRQLATNQSQGPAPTAANQSQGPAPTAANQSQGPAPATVNQNQDPAPTATNQSQGPASTAANQIQGPAPTAANQSQGPVPTS